MSVDCIDLKNRCSYRKIAEAFPELRFYCKLILIMKCDVIVKDPRPRIRITNSHLRVGTSN